MKNRPEILLHPNIPKPMHGLAPRTIMGSVWWDAERQKAYKSTGYTCAACGVPKADAEYHQWLEAHELYAIDYVKGRMVYMETVPLCHACHNFIHSGRMQAMVRKGEMKPEKQRHILERGLQILKAAGIQKTGPENSIADWADWRLVFNGVEYPPIYKTFNEWMAKYK